MEKLKDTTIGKNYQQELEQFKKEKSDCRRLWNIGDNTALLLYSYVILTGPRRILEIGTSNGYSTFWLSIAAEKCDSFIETIEVDDGRFKMAFNNLKTRQNIKMHHGLAENIIPSLNQKFDFVFIDAGKIGYIKYIELIMENKILSDSAVVIADNVVSHESTTIEFLDYIKNSKNFNSITIPIESGLLVAKYENKE